MKQTFYGSLVWLIATLFVIYAFCLNTAAAVFSAPIQTTLQASNLSVSLATGAFILGFACMQIPAGYLLDKYNVRYVVSSGVLLLALGNLATSYATSLTLFTLSNLLQGCGASFAFVAAAILISQWFDKKRFPVLFGLTQSLSCILTGIIHYVFTVMLETHTWMHIYRGLSLGGFALVILSLAVITSPAGLPRTDPPSLWQSLKQVFHNRQILLCAICGATSFGVLIAYASLWYLQIQAYYAVSSLQSMIISGLIFTGIGIGTPLLGYLSNVIRSRKTIIHATLCLGTMALLLGIYLPHYAIDTLIIIKTVSFLIGFFLSGSMLFYTMVNELATAAIRGVAVSVLNTFVFLFNTLMLFLPYLFITTASRQFFAYLWVLPFFTLVSILLVYFIRDTYPR